MICWKIKEEHNIWLALTGSLLIHGLVFICSGRILASHAQYSVQPRYRTIEVHIEDMGPSEAVLGHGEGPAKIPEKANKAKEISHPQSAVKVEANPDYFQNPPPEYPALAKQMGQEGLVLLSADVNREGLPVKVDLIRSCGHRLLDEAALNAVSHWQFEPGRIGGVAVDSTVTVPIRFRLEK